MKKLNISQCIFLFVITILMMPLPCPANNTKGHETVSVGYYQSTRFMEGNKDNAPKTGYGYEYLQNIAYFTGWKYKYVYGLWPEIMEKFRRGEIDLLPGAMDTPENREIILFPDKMMTTNSYLGVKKSRPDLLKKLNEAIKKIDKVEPYLLQNLQYTYYSDVDIKAELTDSENAWLKQHHVIKFGYLEDYLPYSATDAYGRATGLITNVMKGMIEKLPVKKRPSIHYIGYKSYDDMVADLNKGKVDAVFPVGGQLWNAEQYRLYVSSPVVSAGMALVYKGEYGKNTPAKIAVNRNNRMQLNYTITNFPKAQIYYCNSIQECLEAVQFDWANSTVVNGIRVNTLLQKPAFRGLHYVMLSKRDSRCIATDNGNDTLLMLINRGLKVLGQDYGLNASHEYLTYNRTVWDFVMEHSIAFLTLILVFGGIIIALVMVDNRRKKNFLHIESLRNQQLEIAQKEAEYANSAKTKFLNNMSHDIRTPMNAIIGFTDLAMKHPEQHEQVAEYLQKISMSSHHLLSLINEVLDMSRIESGKITLEESVVNLPNMMQDICTMVDASVKEHNQTLDSQLIDLTDPVVMCDELRLNQILINLVGNAIKFTPDGGKIQIILTQKKYEREDYATYEIRVKDNGIGMSEEFTKHVFEAFTREKSSTVSHIQGTGLGMSITKNIVDMMGGTITVKSKLNEGSEFTITLNLKKVDAYDAPVTEEGNESVEFRGKKILLVEDNELNQEIAKTILEELDFKIDIADDGTVAVDKIKNAKSGDYDLVLMDIQMPVMDGYKATRTIRSMNAPLSNIPIIAMTANAFEEDRKKAFDSGMNGHVAKPIDVEVLLKAITAVLK